MAEGTQPADDRQLALLSSIELGQGLLARSCRAHKQAAEGLFLHDRIRAGTEVLIAAPLALVATPCHI